MRSPRPKMTSRAARAMPEVKRQVGGTVRNTNTFSTQIQAILFPNSCKSKYLNVNRLTVYLSTEHVIHVWYIGMKDLAVNAGRKCPKKEIEPWKLE